MHHRESALVAAPSPTVSALINNEVNKQKRHIPVRDLTNQAAEALVEL